MLKNGWGHKSQRKGDATGQIGGNVIIKIHNDHNGLQLNKIRIHESI